MPGFVRTKGMGGMGGPVFIGGGGGGGGETDPTGKKVVYVSKDWEPGDGLPAGTDTDARIVRKRV